MKAVLRFGPLLLLVMSIFFILSGCATDPFYVKSKHRDGIESWNDIKWTNITRQKFDYSCGASALSTLINSYFDGQVSEEIVLLLLLDGMTKEEMADRELNGFSLTDLKRAAHLLGYEAIGVKLKLQDVPKLKGPIIVLLKDAEVAHFAILKGAFKDRIYLADSARGNIRIPLYAFAKQWDGTSLILGKEGFGLQDDSKLSLRPGLDYRPEETALRSDWHAFGRGFRR
jgi:predicted double-glycine peptidase